MAIYAYLCLYMFSIYVYKRLYLRIYVKQPVHQAISAAFPILALEGYMNDTTTRAADFAKYTKQLDCSFRLSMLGL